MKIKTNLIFCTNHLAELIYTLESLHEGASITDSEMRRLKNDTAEIRATLHDDIVTADAEWVKTLESSQILD